MVIDGAEDRHWYTHPLAGFLLLALFALALRGQAMGDPFLGYDEQFYALVGDRMTHGALPYVDIFDRKPIGLFLIFAGAALTGGGLAAYKLLAWMVVTLTAFLIQRAGRRLARDVWARDSWGADFWGGDFAGWIAACLYVVWLNFMEGSGGQGEVWLNLPMLGAALLVWRVRDGGRAVPLGAAAMLLVGIALQIKYTAVFEGLFLGGALLWARWRGTGRIADVVTPGLLWGGCALLPTGLAALYYWHIGAWEAFVFANFLSIFGRVRVDPHLQFIGFLEVAGVIGPLLVWSGIAVWRGWRGPDFAMLWLAAALAGLILFGTFLSPHYAMPLLAPALIAAAPVFARARRVARGFLGFFALLSFAIPPFIELRVGGRAAGPGLVAAAQPHHGCLYVYDGPPALYLLTHSCLPTRWAFPGHLNLADEASARALGVDPVMEEARIMRAMPETVVDYAPEFERGNRATHAALAAALARDYQLVYTYHQQTGGQRLVYRRR